MSGQAGDGGGQSQQEGPGDLLSEGSAEQGARYRPFARLARVLVVLAIRILADLILMIFFGMGLVVIRPPFLFPGLQIPDVLFYNPVVAVWGIAQRGHWAMDVGGVVVFLWWFRRAYGNLPALGRERRFDVGWSIGAWVVPVLNLFRPKGIADELWVAGDAPHAAARPSALVAWWWVLLLLSIMFSSWQGWSLWRIGLLAPDQAGIAMLALGWWADPEFCVDDPDGSVTDVQWFPLREGLRLLREVPYPPLSIPAVAYLGRVAEPPMAWMFTLAEDADVERRWSWRSSVIGPEDDQPLTTSASSADSCGGARE